MSSADAATLAAARWLVYVCAVLVIGHVGAAIVARRASVPDAVAARIRRSLVLSAVLLEVALLAALAVQAHSWFGAEALSDLPQLSSMVTETVWGRHWAIAATGAAAVVIMSLLLRSGRFGSGVLLFVIAATVTVATPQTGHGGAGDAFNRSMHVLHLAAGGLWIGTLTVLAITAWPLLAASVRAREDLGTLLRAFSPIALGSAGVLTLSGMALSAVNLVTWDALWQFDYGRTLVLKVAAVALVVVLGFVNWRSHAHGVQRQGHLRARALLECALGLVIVLAITAWLSGLELPRDQMDSPSGHHHRTRLPDPEGQR